MILESPKASYKVVRVVKSNDANDTYVCKDISSGNQSLYVVLFIKDHDKVHMLLRIFEDSKKDINASLVECFSLDDNFVLVFPYVKERPLDRFYTGSKYTLPECENICVRLVVTLMTCELPFPLLYLMLTQGQLNISRDDDVYMGYQLDFSELDEKITEAGCVQECARIILMMLETKSKETNPMSYSLIEKKIFRQSYNYFVELYKDIRIAAAPSKKRNLWNRIKAFFKRNKDRIFKIILVIAVILGIFVAISFFTNLFLGDIPWLRIFTGGFQYIGTENLAQ